MRYIVSSVSKKGNRARAASKRQHTTPQSTNSISHSDQPLSITVASSLDALSDFRSSHSHHHQPPIPICPAQVVMQAARRMSSHAFQASSTTRQFPPECNVLVIGETQSGKSTLIQFMRKFADRKVKVNTKAIGSDFHSHTQEVKTETIITDLPEHHIVNENGALINHRTFLAMPDENDYRDALNTRRGLKLQKSGSRLPKPVQINLIDTPGLNATDGDDEKHVQKIFDGLIKTKTIHLVLITISPGPFTEGLKDAIKCYVDMFPSFIGIIAFVHTKFDYEKLHPACVKESRAIDLKSEGLHNILGRTTFPHFKINCDISNKRPIRECITQNTIQKILELATFNRPVDMLHTVVNKTRKMRDIDNYLRPRFERAIADIEQTRWLSDPQEGELLKENFRCENSIHKLEARIRALDEFFASHDVAQPEVLFEARRDVEMESGDQGQVVTVCYQEAGAQIAPLPIDRDILYRETQLVREIAQSGSGGLGRSWQGEFRPLSLRHSLLHVKVYASRREAYHNEIEEKRREYEEIQYQRQRAFEFRDKFVSYRETWPQGIKNVVDGHAEKVRVLRLLTNDFVTPEVFKALMNAEVYIGDTAQCLKKVEKMYIELAKQENCVARLSPP